MFVVEVVKDVFKRLRLESPRVHLDISLVGGFNTSRKQKVLLPSTYKRPVLNQLSLTNVLRKAYNWLAKFTQFIPPELRNFTAEQDNKIERNIIEVYVIDNKEPFELFF